MDFEALKGRIEDIDAETVEKQLAQIRTSLLPQGGDADVETIYSNLKILTEREDGRRFIIKNKVPDILCQAILEECKGCEQSITLLESLLLHNGKSCWHKCPDSLNAVISKYTTKLLNTSLDSEKQKYVSFIEKIVAPASGLNDKPFDDLTAKPSWATDLQKCVNSYVEENITVSDANRSLVLQMSGGALALLAHFELTESFLLKTLEDGTLDTSFFVRIAQLTCKETCEILSTTDRLWANEKAQLLKAYYSIIACVLMAVLNSPKVSERSEVMDLVLPPLGEAVNDVISFVTYLASQRKQKFDESLVTETVILLSVGCLVNMAMFQDRVIAVLPFMLGIGRDYYDQTQKFDTKAQSTDVLDIDDRPTDVVGCLLVLLSFLVPDHRCCQIVVDCDFFPVLLDYLQMVETNRASRVDARREIQMVAHIIFASSPFAAQNSRTLTGVGQFLAFNTQYVPQLINNTDSDSPNYVKDVFILTGLSILNDFDRLETGTEEELTPFFTAVIQFYSNDENKNDLCEGFLLDETMKFLDYTPEQASILATMGWARRLGMFCHLGLRFPWIENIILKTDWLPGLIKHIDTCAEKCPTSQSECANLECSESVLAKLCHIFPAVKQYVTDNGGLQLADKWKLGNLHQALTGEMTPSNQVASTSGETNTPNPSSSEQFSVVRGNMGNLVGAFLQFMEQMASKPGEEGGQAPGGGAQSGGLVADTLETDVD